MKLFYSILLVFFISSVTPTFAQYSKGVKKERKRTWRHWNKKKQNYNPYLDKKAKNKPSAKMARDDKKELKRQKRAARKQMRRSKKNLNKG